MSYLIISGFCICFTFANEGLLATRQVCLYPRVQTAGTRSLTREYFYVTRDNYLLKSRYSHIMVVINVIKHSEIHFPRSYVLSTGEHLLKRKTYYKHWWGEK